MKKLKLSLCNSALGLAAVLWCGQANAAFTYTLSSYSGSSHGLTLDGVDGNHIAAKLNMVESTSGSGVSGFASFSTVCLSLNGSLTGGPHTYSQEVFNGELGLNPAWGANNGPGNVGSDFANAYKAINNAAYLFATLSPSVTTDWGALQIAVWAALYNTDSSGNLTGTRFSTVFGGVDDTENTAATYLTMLPSGGAGSYVGYMLKPSEGNPPSGQELIFNPTPVPEPTTMIAGALLLLPFGASTIRFLRKNRTA